LQKQTFKLYYIGIRENLPGKGALSTSNLQY